MVLLTITPTIIEALKELENHQDLESLDTDREDDTEHVEESHTEVAEPSLHDPETGNPISHGQIIDLARNLKENGCENYTLESLLKGSRVYIPPPPPKPEPTSEYKALMARLRHEQESRAYDQMIQAPPTIETFSQRFPTASTFDSHGRTEEDEITYTDINRQMTLIINVLVSIVCCAAALWIAARNWSTIARLFLSMSGSILVAVAEVVIYSGYMRRLGEAKTREGKVREVKEVVNTWVVGGDEKEGDEVVISGHGTEDHLGGLRNRGRARDGNLR